MITQVDRRQQKINEFCKLGNLEDYRDVVESIFAKIYIENCEISSRSDGGPSLHEFQDNNGQCRIRISLLKVYDEPLEIIWTILHEFGHHLSGPIDKKDLNNRDVLIAREELAWKFARIELLENAKLSKNIMGFDKYQQKCLESYKKQK